MTVRITHFSGTPDRNQYEARLPMLGDATWRRPSESGTQRRLAALVNRQPLKRARIKPMPKACTVRRARNSGRNAKRGVAHRSDGSRRELALFNDAKLVRSRCVPLASLA